MTNQLAPLYPAAITLAGDSDTVAQNEFTASVELTVSANAAIGGEILALYLVQHIGSGAVLSDLYGDLVIFDADPSLSAGDTTLTTAQARMVIGRIAWANAELTTDTNTAQLGALTRVPFKPVGSLWFAFFSRGATSINSAGGDDELLELRVGILRRI